MEEVGRWMACRCDDCKISHECTKVVDATIKWLQTEYESIFEDGSGVKTVHRGKVRKYLGMSLDFSHKCTKVVDATIKWLRAEYESIFKYGSGVMHVHRGKGHKYLGMSLDFSHKGQCHVTMYDYLDGI